MCRILIIDNDSETYSNLKNFFDLKNYQTYYLNTGKDFEKNINKIKPDIIIMNIMLSGNNGFHICKSLKGDEEKKKIKIILLSYKDLITLKIEAFDSGCDSFFSAPISFEEIFFQTLKLKKEQENHFYDISLKTYIDSYLYILSKKRPEVYGSTILVYEYIKHSGNKLFLNKESKELLGIAALLHDIGKLVSKDAAHVVEGEEVIKNLPCYSLLKPFLRNHHENLIGTGYPDHLREENFSEELKLLNTVVRYVELLKFEKDRKKCLKILEKEAFQGLWPLKLHTILNQIEREKSLLETIKP